MIELSPEEEENSVHRFSWDAWWNSLAALEKQLWLKRHRELRALVRAGEDPSMEMESVRLLDRLSAGGLTQHC